MIKTLDNFKIVTKTGKSYDMAVDFNVLVRSFVVSTPRPNIETETIENRSGSLRLGKTWGERKITAFCSFFAVDAYDVALLRGEIFRVLMSDDEFYVICDAEPGKRWLVEVSNEWAPERIGTYGEFTLDFVSCSSYAESVGTTLDPFTFDGEFWQFGQGLTVDEKDYKQQSTSFSIYNAGDVKIDPREVPLIIKYKGKASNLKIKNNTTQEEWSYTGEIVQGESLEINQTRSLKNGTVSVFANTNRKLITLAPGKNDIVLLGTSGIFEISFNFRFYYK